VKIVNTVIISSLPIIISRLRITFAASGIPEKLLRGPTAPRPGPIPAIQVATELEAVTGSTPVITTIIVPRTKRKRYKTTNDRIDILVFSARLFPFSFMNEIDLGWLSFTKIFLMFLRTIRCLAILIPPPVDPVLAPENIRRNIKNKAAPGHTK
jgi:hypothetical protein